MIEEAYCSYEVSKLLKEKGFTGRCHRYNTDCDMPTQQMAMRYLREVHNLIIEVRVKHHFRIFDGYYAGIVHLDGDVHYEYTPDVYSTYEEAVEASVRYVLENLL